MISALDKAMTFASHKVVTSDDDTVVILIYGSGHHHMMIVIFHTNQADIEKVVQRPYCAARVRPESCYGSHSTPCVCHPAVD